MVKSSSLIFMVNNQIRQQEWLIFAPTIDFPLHNCKICYQGGVYIKHIVTKVEYCTYWRYWRYCYQGGQGASWFPWMATDTTYQNKKSWHHNLILSFMVELQCWWNFHYLVIPENDIFPLCWLKINICKFNPVSTVDVWVLQQSQWNSFHLAHP